MEIISVNQVDGMTNAEVLDALFPPVYGVLLVNQRAYNEAVDGMKAFAHNFHRNLNVPDVITNPNYDDVMAQLAEYERNHPDEVRPDSPVGKVKGGVFDPGFALEANLPVASEAGTDSVAVESP